MSPLASRMNRKKVLTLHFFAICAILSPVARRRADNRIWDVV